MFDPTLLKINNSCFRTFRLSKKCFFYPPTYCDVRPFKINKEMKPVFKKNVFFPIANLQRSAMD